MIDIFEIFSKTKLLKKFKLSFFTLKSEKFVFILRQISICWTMVQKKRLVVSSKNCPEDVIQAIKEKYPLGYGDAIIKVQKPNGEFFHAITIDLEDVCYLVKVDVKIDNLTDEEFDKQFGSNADDETGGDNFDAKDETNPDTIASPESNFDE